MNIELTAEENKLAEGADVVVLDKGNGTFRVLKDREHDAMSYDLVGIVSRLRSEAAPLRVLWVNR